MNDTKERILDTAERMFAQRGFAETSLRQIVAAARVNLASVHYHFHNKETLLEMVVLRRSERLNRERIALLDECEHRSVAPEVEEILRAFILPLIDLVRDPARGGVTFPQMLGRLHAEAVAGSVHARIVQKHFGNVAERFMAAIMRALPEIPPVEIFWRAMFAVGVFSEVLKGLNELDILSGGACSASDFDGAVTRAIAFMAAGFRAPVGTAALAGVQR